MTQEAIDLHIGQITVDDPGGLLGDALAEFRVAPGVTRPETAKLVVHEGPVPDRSPPEAQITDHEGTELHFWRADDRRCLLVPGAAMLEIGPGPLARLCLAPGAPNGPRNDLAMVALEEGTHASGQAMVHCAALRPEGREGLVLLHAASGTGKTTTSLALAAAGFALAADDAAVIGPDEDGRMAAWGLPRALNLHRRTASMLDWLRPALPDPWPDQDEVAVPQAHLPPPVRLERRRLPVLAVVELRRGEATCLGPIAPADALTALVSDNVRVTRSGLWPVQQGRLDRLVAMVEQVPCYALTVAPGGAGLAAASAAMASAF
jgi:hypothetical protein